MPAAPSLHRSGDSNRSRGIAGMKLTITCATCGRPIVPDPDEGTPFVVDAEGDFHHRHCFDAVTIGNGDPVAEGDG